MTFQRRITDGPEADRLTRAAAALGYEIVDIAGFLDLIEEHAQAQKKGLIVLANRAEEMTNANTDVRAAAQVMAKNTDETVQDVQSSAALVRATGEKTNNVANWVQELSTRTATVSETLSAVTSNTAQIASIAKQVNSLAINAKIEAARAGDAGRGFAVVAEAINDLSQKTRGAAVEISENIEALTTWIATLGTEAASIAADATEVLNNADGTDAALGRMETSITEANTQAKRIAVQADRMHVAMNEFSPSLNSIGETVRSTSSGIEETHSRVLRLIDMSEIIVQSTALLGRASEDASFIHAVQENAGKIEAALEAAIDSGQTDISQVFDRSYRPVPNTNPEQFTTRVTQLLDQLLPAVQEPALNIDPKVVFCAAVDVNGYLPTHNKKFSQPQSNDPVWNTGNCRNRRIFDDRVGLKAGRNTQPFLLQVYRRDMGGGEFMMMKDLSAPIFVKGQHWGGLRLAYAF